MNRLLDAPLDGKYPFDDATTLGNEDDEADEADDVSPILLLLLLLKLPPLAALPTPLDDDVDVGGDNWDWTAVLVDASMLTDDELSPVLVATWGEDMSDSDGVIVLADGESVRGVGNSVLDDTVGGNGFGIGFSTGLVIPSFISCTILN